MKLTGFVLVLLLWVLNAIYPAASAGETAIDYFLHVSPDIESSKITGMAGFPVKKDRELTLSTGKLTILGVNLNRQDVAYLEHGATLKILPPSDGTLEITYEGVFTEPPDLRQSLQPSNTISGRGIFLTGLWYPALEQMCIFHLTASLPEGYVAVSEAETVEETSKDGRAIFDFSFPHPLESINLVATNRHSVVREVFRGIELCAYFFPEDAALVPTYLDHARRYLSLYERLISEFPYKRFSIVENFLPTGYSMPTFTLLGQEVVRLPFIPETSLGHEILHQWFGNLVYIDDENGNWAEGLTTFLADYLYEEEKGKGVEYRKSILIDYMSYVNERNEIPLGDFRARTDPASAAIGYGKALMVFEMLRRLMGKESFYDAVKDFTREMRFRKASWGDLRRAFEKHYRRDLGWFFHQWVDEKGLPTILLEEVNVRPTEGRFVTTFKIRQERKAYGLELPVSVYSSGERATTAFDIRRERETGSMTLDDFPRRVSVDENYEVARRLAPDEFPPVLARLMGDGNPIMVLPPSMTGVYEKIIRSFEKKGVRLKRPEEITLEDLKTSSFIILGLDHPWVGRLYGEVSNTAGFSVIVKENPWNNSKVAAIFDGRSREEVNAAFPKVLHYGKYSVLHFDHGENTHKATSSSTRGITKEVSENPVAVQISELQGLPSVIEGVANKKIVYIGEIHDRYSNHVTQLEIIKALHRKGKPIAIGMEMFQRPFQKVLDEYVEGKIDERQFLKSTHYFERWGFDYRLYRPILLFARAERIPLIALNAREEIVNKVFREGLYSLSAEEKEDLPKEMDFSDEIYRERLKETFREHETSQKKPLNFDFFYQAQVLWDETMAESVDTFLKAHPEHQVVVLAGNGHLAHGFGIPKRCKRRNGHSYAIILNDADLEKGIADYVLFPGTIPGGSSPVLMVMVREEKSGVVITGFPPESVSEKAGMKAGDVILSIDLIPVRRREDIKIELLTKEKGDKLKVRILRVEPSGTSQEMDFEVALH